MGSAGDADGEDAPGTRCSHGFAGDCQSMSRSGARVSGCSTASPVRDRVRGCPWDPHGVQAGIRGSPGWTDAGPCSAAEQIDHQGEGALCGQEVLPFLVLPGSSMAGLQRPGIRVKIHQQMKRTRPDRRNGMEPPGPTPFPDPARRTGSTRHSRTKRCLRRLLGVPFEQDAFAYSSRRERAW